MYNFDVIRVLLSCSVKSFSLTSSRCTAVGYSVLMQPQEHAHDCCGKQGSISNRPVEDASWFRCWYTAHVHFIDIDVTVNNYICNYLWFISRLLWSHSTGSEAIPEQHLSFRSIEKAVVQYSRSNYTLTDQIQLLHVSRTRSRMQPAGIIIIHYPWGYWNSPVFLRPGAK